MALERLRREDISLKNIAQEAYIKELLNRVDNQDIKIVHLLDEQFEMRNEIDGYKETMGKLENDVRKDKRWNMFWHNHLDDNIDKTQILLAIVFSINILFTYFMSR